MALPLRLMETTDKQGDQHPQVGLTAPEIVKLRSRRMRVSNIFPPIPHPLHKPSHRFLNIFFGLSKVLRLRGAIQPQNDLLASNRGLMPTAKQRAARGANSSHEARRQSGAGPWPANLPSRPATPTIHNQLREIGFVPANPRNPAHNPNQLREIGFVPANPRNPATQPPQSTSSRAKLVSFRQTCKPSSHNPQPSRAKLASFRQNPHTPPQPSVVHPDAPALASPAVPRQPPAAAQPSPQIASHTRKQSMPLSFRGARGKSPCPAREIVRGLFGRPRSRSLLAE